jgi:hypothetical protein
MQKQLSYRQKQTVASSGGWGYHFNLFQLTISRPTSETRALRNNFHFICSLVRPSVRPSTSFLSSLSLSLPFFLFFSIFCQPGRSAQPEYLPRQHFALFLFSSLTFFFFILRFAGDLQQHLIIHGLRKVIFLFDQPGHPLEHNHQWEGERASERKRGRKRLSEARKRTRKKIGEAAVVAAASSGWLQSKKKMEEKE